MPHFARRLAVITGVAAAGRLVRWWLVKWDQELLLNDSLYYSAQARQLTQGRFFRDVFEDVPAAEHGPLTSIVLAPFSFGDDPVRWQRLGTIVLGVIVVALIGLLGRRIGGDRVGLVAAAIAAVYPNLWLNDGLVMAESLAALLSVATLLVLLDLQATPDVRRGILFGALVGLATLTRSELALFVPLAWIVVVRAVGERRRTLAIAAAMTVAAVGVVAPWTAFNLTRFERPVVLTTNDGTTLIGAYCPATFEGEHVAGWFIGCVWEHPSFTEPEPSVRSALQREAAFEFIADNAGAVPPMMVRRVARSFDLTAVDQLIDHAEGEEREPWAVRAGMAAFWVLLPLAAVGAMRIERRHLLVLVLPVVTTVLVSALFYGAQRFRIAMEPVVVVLAAVTLVDLARDRARSPMRPVP
ncbi:MAG: glycosyltransferase family 39 protein [Ilumatobacteraceae bacterium]